MALFRPCTIICFFLQVHQKSRTKTLPLFNPKDVHQFCYQHHCSLDVVPNNNLLPTPSSPHHKWQTAQPALPYLSAILQSCKHSHQCHWKEGIILLHLHSGASLHSTTSCLPLLFLAKLDSNHSAWLCNAWGATLALNVELPQCKSC